MRSRCGLEDCDCEYTIEKLLKALEAAFIQTDDDVFYRTRDNVPQDVPERIARQVRTAIREARGPR